LKKPVYLLKDKLHLTIEGKKKKIKELKDKLNIDNKLPVSINITDDWLLGFIEGDASFSTSGLMPRLKFENHIKEFKLLQEIQRFIGYGSLINKNRKYRGLNENPTAVLEINKIIDLKNFVEKYRNNFSLFLTKNYFDFKD
jgi:hypothetical protein